MGKHENSRETDFFINCLIYLPQHFAYLYNKLLDKMAHFPRKFKIFSNFKLIHWLTKLHLWHSFGIKINILAKLNFRQSIILSRIYICIKLHHFIHKYIFSQKNNSKIIMYFVKTEFCTMLCLGYFCINVLVKEIWVYFLSNVKTLYFWKK